MAALHPYDRAALRQRRRVASAKRWTRAGLIALPIVAGIGVSASATLSVMQRGRPAAAAPRALPTPAIAAPDYASPAQGTTGTIELPPEPPAVPLPAAFERSIIPAAPFNLVGASALDRGRALECLSTAIYYEAASESDEGQRAVAQVILNRVRHPAFPGSVCGVVYQGSEKAGCQFSFACDGALARVPSRSGLARATRIAAEALAGQVYAPVGLATHYHTYAVTPAWNRTLVMTDAVGAHFFHRWKGYWGTAAAFTQRYRGGEPVPGPHPRLTPLAPSALPSLVLAAAAAPRIAPALTPSATIQPAFVESGAVRVDDAASNLPPASEVLDRWKDSGKPLK